MTQPIQPGDTLRSTTLQALKRPTAAMALAVMVFLTSGCTALVAQNPSSAFKPVNAVADGGDDRVMLKGYDVVAYFTQNRHVLGTPEFKSVYEGTSFRFSNAQHKALFDAAPEKYLPQYGGYCANGAPYSILLGGGASTYKIVDGRLFMFSGPDSLKYWEMDEKRNLELGEKYWRDELNNTSSAFFHSWWRVLAAKVPHYKSGKELEAEWQTRQTKKG